MPPVCDFCSSPDIVKDYACESFTALDMTRESKRLIANSEGYWAACKLCADLIDHDKWEELAQRSYETNGYKPDDPHRDILMDFLRGMHHRFRVLRLKAN